MKVYIAGPYTKPDPLENVRKAIFFAEWLAALGHYPYIPLLTHYWEEQYHHDYEFWMKQDEEFLKVCDAVLRLDGESAGADRETALAERLGIPVFHSVLELARTP